MSLEEEQKRENRHIKLLGLFAKGYIGESDLFGGLLALTPSEKSVEELIDSVEGAQRTRFVACGNSH